MKRTFGVCACAGLTAAFLCADGGSLLLRKQAGPLTLSVFGSPEPLRPGPADLSVMVQRTADHSSVLDAKVIIQLSKTGSGAISELYAPATHARATNKLLYAAALTIPEPGTWQLTVQVEGKSGTAELATQVNVLPRQAPIVAYWPYFAVVPVIALLFLLNQWLKGKRRSEHLRAQH